MNYFSSGIQDSSPSDRRHRITLPPTFWAGGLYASTGTRYKADDPRANSSVVAVPVLTSFCSGPSRHRLAWRVPPAGGTLHERQNRLNRNLLQKNLRKRCIFRPPSLVLMLEGSLFQLS